MDTNENIKLLCKAAGISFTELADRLQVTRQTLYRQTTGSPTLATLERIAAALQVPPFILLHPAPLAALQRWNAGPSSLETEKPATAPDPHPDPARLIITDPDTGQRWIIQKESTQAAACLPVPGPDGDTATQDQTEGEKPRRKRGRPRKQQTQEETTLL